MKRLALEALAVLLVAAALLAGWNHYIAGVRARADKAGYERRDNEQKDADNKALREALADVARLNEELQGITSDAKRQREAAAAAGVRARDAGERLRAAEAQLAAQLVAACADTTAGPGSAATHAALDLFADVRRRLDAAQDAVTAFADASHVAGLACQRQYDALK